MIVLVRLILAAMNLIHRRKDWLVGCTHKSELAEIVKAQIKIVAEEMEKRYTFLIDQMDVQFLCCIS